MSPYEPSRINLEVGSPCPSPSPLNFKGHRPNSVMWAHGITHRHVYQSFQVIAAKSCMPFPAEDIRSESSAKIACRLAETSVLAAPYAFNMTLTKNNRIEISNTFLALRSSDASKGPRGGQHCPSPSPSDRSYTIASE